MIKYFGLSINLFSDTLVVVMILMVICTELGSNKVGDEMLNTYVYVAETVDPTIKGTL